jgi:hypothetical protein
MAAIVGELLSCLPSDCFQRSVASHMCEDHGAADVSRETSQVEGREAHVLLGGIDGSLVVLEPEVQDLK